MSQLGSTVGVWRKSSRCESQQCVEVARTVSGVAVRDSAAPVDHLEIAAPAWRNFLSAIRVGDLRN
ncbi:hypothetical protein GCM10027280_24730 [Micromonospora polyrhachis]|uniref:DUF397 domain-containing protein n=1 Tax=Micromonospora polyrhachis TaxID=1282883 RepID=A0A7W7ST60_9ACTN|nr:DUF397 domain-containing protein [Micromonospora polyrhachis]MBB4960434.1 hypothetical protein [Micromonospora polyrhachis]